ncbi:glycosyltransferase [Puia sp.]|jgi:hypothetical protein|uniref:glycosyltransferase n=1 Tax=Puia sp. TaxID=2045100 RepID=UPI002F3F94A7
MNNKIRDNAPVLLFTFKRLDTLKHTVSNLQQNALAKESDLIIFSDQALVEADTAKVAAVRTYIKTIAGFKSIRIVEAQQNTGLANSIINGVSKMLDQYGKVIVLEDDLLTTPNFLSFMNQALDDYQHEDAVFSISGYSFDLAVKKGPSAPDAYFLNRGWSWGWGTWKDRWRHVDWNMQDYRSFSTDPFAKKKFAQGGSDLNGMLRRQMQGKLDSWAIRWFYHQLKTGGLTLYPVLSKVYNDGFDEMATHTRGSNSRYQPMLDDTGRDVFRLPEEIQIDPAYQRKFQGKLGVPARILSRIQTIIDKIIK